MALALARANMLGMNRSAVPNILSPRRFILLPEETALGAPEKPRVRRYKLSGLSSCAFPSRTAVSSAGRGARFARVAGRLEGL